MIGRAFGTRFFSAAQIRKGDRLALASLHNRGVVRLNRKNRNRV